MTRFLHLTNNLGIDANQIKNSYFSKLALKAPLIKNPQRLISDLNIVRENFKQLGWETTHIDTDIAQVS